MKLSIIVPVYKAENFLRRCVDSLLAQNVEDFEIILVNDGSPDNSQAIIDEYAAAYPERVKDVAVENGGQGRARNIGIEMARGAYLGFIDSDDWIEPDMYPKLLSAAEEQNADVVVCGIRNCHDDGSSEVPTIWREDRPVAAAGSACNKLFLRDTVGEIRFPEGKLWYEDFAFSAKLMLKAKKIAYVPEALYDYRIGHTSTMNNQNAAKNLDILVIMEDIRRFMEERGAGRDDYEYLLINHVLLDSVNRISLQHSPDKLAAIARLRAFVREQIPDLDACPAYRQESRNRRIIMKLNYLGLEDLSKLLLKVKKAL